MERYVDLGELPLIEQFLRSSLGGEPWMKWGRDYILRHRMMEWANAIGEDKILAAMQATAACGEGPMSFWDGVDYTLRIKYQHDLEVHQREDPE